MTPTHADYRRCRAVQARRQNRTYRLLSRLIVIRVPRHEAGKSSAGVRIDWSQSMRGGGFKGRQPENLTREESEHVVLAEMDR